MKLIDRFRHIRIIRTVLYAVVGFITYPGLVLINKVKIEGTENLFNLPKKNVLFVSNHQTYFADVITFFQILCAIKWGKKDRLGIPYYLLNPFTRVNYVAAVETMKDNLLTRLFLLAGGITVKRTWRAEGKDVRRGLDPSDTRKIVRALEKNWVITFPQGTTKSFKPVRKGTAHIIKQHKPIVVPIVIDGFRRSFDKKGLRVKKKNILQSFIIKEPLVIDYENETIEQIVEKVEYAIEQHPSFLKVIPAEELAEQERLNQLRKWQVEKESKEEV